MAELTGRNNEIRIHRHLAAQSGAHAGSDRVLVFLDHLGIRGVNGEHDVLVSEIIGPHLVDIFDGPIEMPKVIKSLAQQIALEISFLHDYGVVHAGQSIVLLAGRQLIGVA